MSKITTLKRISELESVVSAYITASESRWSREKSIELLNEGRAAAISNTVQNGTRIHPSWQQELVLPYDEAIQESCNYSTFGPMPSIIKLEKAKDGVIFVGNEDFTVQYSRFNTAGELLNAMKHRILRRKIENGVAALLDGDQWKIYTDLTFGKIKSFGTKAIFNDPTSLPYFNIAEDEYPIDATTFEFCLGYLKDKYLSGIASTPVLTDKTNKNLPFQIPSRHR